MASTSEGDLQVAEVLAATFAGRRDAYVAWTGTGYVTLRRPLTARVVLEAIRSGRPVSGFFLDPASRSHVAALDFDRPDGWELACRVGAWLWQHGIPAYAERSRAGRAHLWLVLERDADGAQATLPGIVLWRALKAALAANGLADAPDIELRPATDRLSGPDGLGHALRLPTMPHRITGERHPLCDPRTGEPLGRSMGEMLLALEYAAPDRLIDLAGQQYLPPPVGQVAAKRRQWQGGTGPIGRFNDAVGVCAVLAREFGVTTALPGRTIRCPLHDDRRPSLSIARDDSRAWCHSPSCPLHGPNGAGHDAYSLWRLSKERTGAA